MSHRDPPPLAIGALELGPVPRLAAPASDADLAEDGARIGRLADLVELRVDQFARPDPEYAAGVCRDARALGRPLIATVRAAAEGGAVELPDDSRLAVFEAVAPLVDALDVEFHAPIRDDVIALARRFDKAVIVSHHDFAGTPLDADLVAITEAAVLAGASVVKLTTLAGSVTDVDRLLGLLRDRRHQGLIVIAMGPHGVASRVFFPLLGSLITYGFVRSAAAPGQLSLADLYDALRLYSPEFAATHVAR